MRGIASLDPETDPGVDEARRQEAEHRLDEIESGRVSTITADQAIEKARSTLR